MKIKTEQHPWNIYEGTRWSAYDDDTYDGPGSPVGTGGTEIEAIEDLATQIVEKLEDHADRLSLLRRAADERVEALEKEVTELRAERLREIKETNRLAINQLGEELGRLNRIAASILGNCPQTSHQEARGDLAEDAAQEDDPREAGLQGRLSEDEVDDYDYAQDDLNFDAARERGGR